MDTDTESKASAATERNETGAAPQQSPSMPPYRRGDRLIQRILCVVLAIVFALLAGTGGYLIWYYTRDPAQRTLDWVKGMVETCYYRGIPEDVLETATMDDLFGTSEKEGLLDRYSAYYTAEELEKQMQTQQGHYTGTGLSFVQSEEGTFIYRVSGNSPAEESGLKAGMYLLAYGDDERTEIPFEEFGDFSSFVAAQAEEEVFYLRADEDPTGEGTVYSVYKTDYTQNYVFYSDAEDSRRYTGERTEAMGVDDSEMPFLPDDAAYIRIESFAGGAAEQLGGMLEVFAEKGKKKLVLDLRNNGGGQLDILAEIAAMLCKGMERGDPVLTMEYRDRTETCAAPSGQYSRYFSAETEIKVLANYNTASASEALIGAMLDYGSIGYEDICLAEIDGVSRTYGKGIMQTTYRNFLTGEGIKLTTARICWPRSGNCIQDRGILPSDGALSLPCAGETDRGDAMLRAAVEYYFG